MSARAFSLNLLIFPLKVTVCEIGLYIPWAFPLVWPL